MLRILVLILILLPTISNADQGFKISCLNMKSILGKKYEPLKFTLEAVGLQYFDEVEDKFVMIKISYNSFFFLTLFGKFEVDLTDLDDMRRKFFFLTCWGPGIGLKP